MREHVEQRFARAIAGRARIASFRRGDRTPFELAADNPHGAVSTSSLDRHIALIEHSLDAYLTLRE
jgi:hypothetical protein